MSDYAGIIRVLKMVAIASCLGMLRLLLIAPRKARLSIKESLKLLILISCWLE